VIPDPRRADPLDVAVDFAQFLGALGVRYALTGSMASAVHGEPRSTVDVDLIADLSVATSTRLVSAIEATYYVDAEVARQMTESAGSFNAIHLASAIKVDIFVTGDDPFEQERLRRRIQIALPDSLDQHLWIDAAECTVLRKLEWYRRGGEVSERQWRDVVAILRLQQSALNDDFLDAWAPSLGVSDLLARVRAAAFDR